jgi:hypothetical protein
MQYCAAADDCRCAMALLSSLQSTMLQTDFVALMPVVVEL